MGGIVAAEALIALSSDQPVPAPSSSPPPPPPGGGATKPSSSSGSGRPSTGAPENPSFNHLMFPYIQAVLAFDTPYLGISPGVVAHGAEGHYQAASSAYNVISGLWSPAGGSAQAAATTAKASSSAGALPAPPSAAAGAAAKGVGGGWGKWGTLAMYAGAGAAVVGAGAAAYLNREQIGASIGWASSHLEFVGCLARREELRRRVAYVVRAERELGVGFANMYTRLGRAAGEARSPGVAGVLVGRDRTFCVLPPTGAGGGSSAGGKAAGSSGGDSGSGKWIEAVNDAAKDETWAHMCELLPGTLVRPYLV